MITQQHNNEIQQKTQAPSPVKQHRWIVVLLSILGVAVPLIAGRWVNWPLVELNFAAHDLFVTAFVYVILPVAVGAFLLCLEFRVRWVTVLAGVAWIVGEFLAAVFRPLVEGQPAPWTWGLVDQLRLIFLALLPLLIGMVVGAAIAFTLVEVRKKDKDLSPQ